MRQRLGILAATAMVVAVAATPAAPAKPKTFTVCKHGCQYRTIQGPASHPSPPPPLKHAHLHGDSSDGYFLPVELKVEKGSKVRWDWKHVTGGTHNVTLDKGPKGVKKGDLSSADSGDSSFTFTRRLKVAGKYQFYCTYHPITMRMTVNVKH